MTASPGVYLGPRTSGRPVEVTSAADVAGYCQPNDPFALLKACLVLSGVLDPTTDDPLAGGGRTAGQGPWIRLRPAAGSPVAPGWAPPPSWARPSCGRWARVLGRPPDDAELSRQTLSLEQLMTTGGGWQDQMGAIAPGIKLVTTAPGPEQRPRVDGIPLSPAAGPPWKRTWWWPTRGTTAWPGTSCARW